MRGLIKKQIGLFIVIIILMILTIISSSYALFKTENRLTTISHQTQAFNVTYSSGSPTLSGNIYAMTYQEAMEQHDYQITISSNGTTNYGTIYHFEFFNNPPANFTGELVNPQYIWIAVDNYAQRMSDLSTVEEDGITYYTFGSAVLNPNSSITHNIDVWLDNDIPSSEVDKYVYLEVRVTSEATSEFDYKARQTICSVIDNTYGNPGEIGSKYECDLGDGISRVFYLLKNDELTNTVKLIYEKNVSDLVGSNVTMTWANANAFFDEGNDGYTVKQAWNKVINVDLPSVQDIMDASLAVNPKEGFSVDFATQGGDWWCLGSHEKDEPSGPPYCPTSEAQQKAAWLFSYTRDCASRGCYYEYPESGGSYPYGYWTKDLVATDNTRAWGVIRHGSLDNPTVTNTGYGVRPVVTLYKTNLNNTLPPKACNYLNSTFGDANDHLSVSTEYECDLGDGVKRNFYILSKNNQTGEVKLIMEQNLSDTVGSNKTMTWANANAFFDEGNDGYAVKQAWNKVINVDLPSVQEIMDASLAVNPKDGFSVDFTTQGANWWCLGTHEKDEPSGPLYCPTSEAQQKAAWLFSYTRDCASRGCYYEYPASGGSYPYGYWTKDLVATNNTLAWYVHRNGLLNANAVTYPDHGVRPVITISTSEINSN